MSLSIARQCRLDNSGFLLEPEHIAGWSAEYSVLSAKNEGRADIGMTGKRNFHGRREDPHARRIGRVLWRQHEGDFGIAEFGGDVLHLRVREAACVGNDG
ncbi:hypothetical protein D9M69_708340 [compost metagenome]